MREVFQLFKQSRTFRLILRSYIPLLVLSIVGCCFAFYEADKTLQSNMRAGVNRQFSYISENLGFFDEDLDSTYTQFQFDTDILPNYDTAGYSKQKVLKDKLHLYTLPHRELYDIWYYCHGDAHLYSGRDSNTVERFISRYGVANNVEEWNTMLLSLRETRVINAYDAYRDKEVLFFIFPIHHAQPKMDHSILFEVDKETFASRYLMTMDNKSMKVEMRTPKETLLITGSDQTGGLFLEPVIYERTGNGWTLTMAANVSYLYRILLFLCSLAIICVVGLTVLLHARQQYMPISQIRYNIQNLLDRTNDMDDPIEDDYEYIQSGLSTFCESQQKMQFAIADQSDAFLRCIHYNLLCGHYTSFSAFFHDVEPLNIQLKGDRCRLILLDPDIQETIVRTLFEGEYVFGCPLSDLYGTALIILYTSERSDYINALCQRAEELCSPNRIVLSDECDAIGGIPRLYVAALCKLWKPVSGESDEHTAMNLMLNDATFDYELSCDVLRQYVVAEELGTEEGTTPSPSLTDQMFAYLQNNFDDPNFSIQTMADAFEMPLSTLSSRFKAAAGITLTAQITQLRMDKAKHLLETTNLSIQEVSMLSGYFNYASFTRRFRLECDMTPGVYRQEHKRSCSK